MTAHWFPNARPPTTSAPSNLRPASKVRDIHTAPPRRQSLRPSCVGGGRHIASRSYAFDVLQSRRGHRGTLEGRIESDCVCIHVVARQQCPVLSMGVLAGFLRIPNWD